MNGNVLLTVRGLTKHFDVRLGAFGDGRAKVYALDDVDMDIERGETLSVVGESGCGKSTTGFALLNLHRPTRGSVVYEGTDLAKLSEKEMRPIRRHLQVVFQDPYSTLNPRMTVGDILSEPLLLHRIVDRHGLAARLQRLLDDVGLPHSFAKRYPHELSGGQRQRVAIARALACEPRFIVCDEAISALDVSVQAQVLNLLMDLQEKYGLTYLFIAHDLAVVRLISTRVMVMYLGRQVELAPAAEIFEAPLHPYTQALLSAIPEPDPDDHLSGRRTKLQGEVPSPMDPPSGCRFHTRCPLAMDTCRQTVPAWRSVRPNHFVACHAV